MMLKTNVEELHFFHRGMFKMFLYHVLDANEKKQGKRDKHYAGPKTRDIT